MYWLRFEKKRLSRVCIISATRRANRGRFGFMVKSESCANSHWSRWLLSIKSY